ncbi:hypothetical protein AGMMS49531_02640 [Endomicrobiia bacterium]|nr:hypothetical protein AGMMS49531_02640 [Endomicrobiia bacterium]
MVNFGLEFINTTDRILQNVQEQGTTAAIIVSSVVLFYCDKAVSTTLHETGHGLRAKSYGIDYQLLLDDRDESPFKKDENFIKFFLGELLNTKRAACSVDTKQMEGLEKSLDKSSAYNGLIIFAAGGMNNEVQLAEKISDDIYSKKKKPGLFSYAMYLSNRLSPILYGYMAEKPGDDPFSIQYHFKQRGENNFKKETISNAGWISLLLSATTYSALTDKPLQFHGFRIPDIFPYITKRGMSYKAVSGYEVRDGLNLIFGLERAFKIEPATECSLGISHHMIDNKFPISYSGIVTFGQGFDFEASCSIPLSKSFSLGAGCEIYSVKSLQGQRNATTNMKESNGFSKNFFASVSYRF